MTSAFVASRACNWRSSFSGSHRSSASRKAIKVPCECSMAVLRAFIIRAFSARDSRVKYLFQQNGRQAKARNTAIEHSHGTLISFLDADDLWLPEKLDRQLQALEATNADVIYSNGLIIYEPGAIPGRNDFAIVSGTIEGRKMLDVLLLQNRIPVQSVVVRKEAYRNAGPFDESPLFHGCEDYELWLRLAARGAL